MLVTVACEYDHGLPWTRTRTAVDLGQHHNALVLKIGACDIRDEWPFDVWQVHELDYEVLREMICWKLMTTRIRLQQDNPKRGSSRKRYASYKSAETIYHMRSELGKETVSLM